MTWLALLKYWRRWEGSGSQFRTSLFLVSMWFDGLCFPACLPQAMVPSWKVPRHTHLACRLPLWSVSPFVSTMLMKALSVSTDRTPGRLLMSSLFDRDRHDARFFFFIPPGWCSFAPVHVCVFIVECVVLNGRETRRRGLVSWLGLVYNKRGRVVVF